jgi:hypothetical protein
LGLRLLSDKIFERAEPEKIKNWFNNSTPIRIKNPIKILFVICGFKLFEVNSFVVVILPLSSDY